MSARRVYDERVMSVRRAYDERAMSVRWDLAKTLGDHPIWHLDSHLANCQIRTFDHRFDRLLNTLFDIFLYHIFGMPVYRRFLFALSLRQNIINGYFFV